MLALEESEKGLWEPLYILSSSCMRICNYLTTKNAITDILRKAYFMQYHRDSLNGPKDFQVPGISYTHIV